MSTATIKNMLRPIKLAFDRFSGRLNPLALQREVDTLYSMLYNLSHDLDQSVDLCSTQTKDAFAHQWSELPEGQYLLTDPWFKSNVTRILSEEEIQIRPEWFAGKEVLDAGCGNGRWSYGLAQLGAKVTSVDINQVALEKTAEALRDAPVKPQFIHSSLESLSDHLPADKKFDLVFSWGVIHHAKSFNRCLRELAGRVKENGILYLYLYGRESLSYADDVRLFKERIRYNSLSRPEDRYRFLLKKARGNKDKVHAVHDVYAPLVNRRLDYPYVEQFLTSCGFAEVTRTIDHTELFVRALKGDLREWHDRWVLPKKQSPYWFQHHQS